MQSCGSGGSSIALQINLHTRYNRAAAGGELSSSNQHLAEPIHVFSLVTNLFAKIVD
jgi:hypothetical protein